MGMDIRTTFESFQISSQSREVNRFPKAVGFERQRQVIQIDKNAGANPINWPVIGLLINSFPPTPLTHPNILKNRDGGILIHGNGRYGY